MDLLRSLECSVIGSNLEPELAGRHLGCVVGRKLWLHLENRSGKARLGGKIVR